MRSNDVPEAAELTVPFIKARQHGTVTGALQVEILRAVPPCRDKGGAESSHKAQGVRRAPLWQQLRRQLQLLPGGRCSSAKKVRIYTDRGERSDQWRDDEYSGDCWGI